MSASAGLAGLHVLADTQARWRNAPEACARAACAGGASVIQLRAKADSDRDTLAVARRLRAITREAGVLFFVNDRFDLALAADADGVHLGQGDLPPARLPEPARARLLVGRSTHDAEQLERAAKEPLDYVAFGPIFGTRSKDSEWSARGLDALAAATARIAPRPLVAIGGIDASNVAAVAATGAGAAVISAVAEAGDPLEATRALCRAMRDGRPLTH